MITKNIKQVINNIRGVEMALSTVITIVLLLIVLIIAAMFFLGGSETALDPIMGIGKTAGRQAEGSRYLDWLS